MATITNLDDGWDEFEQVVQGHRNGGCSWVLITEKVQKAAYKTPQGQEWTSSNLRLWMENREIKRKRLFAQQATASMFADEPQTQEPAPPPEPEPEKEQPMDTPTKPVEMVDNEQQYLAQRQRETIRAEMACEVGADLLKDQSLPPAMRWMLTQKVMGRMQVGA